MEAQFHPHFVVAIQIVREASLMMEVWDQGILYGLDRFFFFFFSNEKIFFFFFNLTLNEIYVYNTQGCGIVVVSA